MRIITPAQATVKLKGFIERVDRIKADSYKRKASKTYDKKTILWEMSRVGLWASIAKFSKNSDNAQNVIDRVKNAHLFVSNMIFDGEL
ncbi:MAG: hypothetical protein CL843_09335 [Crocinitomicaceae bacterium]|nr:hypothetical protein [Crocinitomicaceae bacterium]|tara:strand:- start:304 stop:567 length:264 start_codon:yes stop_codon:yes gene_type:complete